MNNETFLIEEFDLDSAKDICKLISEPALRNRCVSNVAAATLATKYFQDIDIDSESGIHNIYQILENINISDIYIKDNYIDVRLYFNENEIFVPKTHFDSNLLPVAYMFIKIEDNLSSGTVTGFITPDIIDTAKEYNGYYRIKEDELISFYDIESMLINKDSEDLPNNFESQVFDYLDNKMADSNSFYKLLLESREARLKLHNAAKAQCVFNFISIPATGAEITATEQSDFELLEESTGVEMLEDTEPDFSISEDEPEEIEPIEEVQSLEMADSDSFSLVDEEMPRLGIEESIIEPIEEVQSLEMANSDSFSLVDEEMPSLEIEEPATEAIDEPVEELVTIQEEYQETAEEEPTYSSLEADSDSGFDFDSDSIQMLNTNSYEEQSTSDFSSFDTLEDSEDEISIGMLDSSSLKFDEEPIEQNFVTEEIPQEEIFEPALDIAEDEPEVNVGESTVEIQIDNKADEEDDSFDFSTSITPSLDALEDEQEQETFEEEMTDLTEEMLDAQDIDIPVTENDGENTEQIDTLFNQEEENAAIPVKKAKSKNLLLPITLVVVILAAIGYYSYTKFTGQQQPINEISDTSQNTIQPVEPVNTPEKAEEAMPVETVENVKLQLNTNEGNSVSIPAIEQNLDASITVSNLKVEFEIPASYKASKTAERYFTKMGKIIQLNLKTELLLLSNQPITNKIAVELEFNKGTQKFEVKGLTATSGDQKVDELILRTVKSSLDINLNMNMNIFGTVAGNPVLVIKL